MNHAPNHRNADPAAPAPEATEATDIAIPVLPCRDMAALVAFYGPLGFEGGPHPDDANYAILTLGRLELHFFLHRDLVPADSWAGAYLRVSQVDALHRQMAAAGLPARGIPRLETPADKPWGLREFALVDPDGNLLRIGQVLPED